MSDFKLFTSIEKLFPSVFQSVQDYQKKVVADFIFRCAAECYLKLVLSNLRKDNNKHD